MTTTTTTTTPAPAELPARWWALTGSEEWFRGLIDIETLSYEYQGDPTAAFEDGGHVMVEDARTAEKAAKPLRTSLRPAWLLLQRACVTMGTEATKGTFSVPALDLIQKRAKHFENLATAAGLDLNPPEPGLRPQ